MVLKTLLRLLLITICINSVTYAQPVNPGATLRANTFTDTQTISKTANNSTPGTTRHLRLDNGGGYSWIDAYFSGTLRSALGFDSSGGISLYQSGGNGEAVYNCNAGLSSCSLQSYNYVSGFTHYGYGGFVGGVNAGGSSQGTSTLSNQGTLENKTILVTTSQILTSSATNILCDGSTAAACTGTPSNSCGSHGDSSSCALYNYHGGCAWFAGNSCSVYNGEYNMGSCIGTSGCSADAGSCTGGDESTCLANDDPYGGNCTWSNNPISCAGFDESTCSMTSGCSPQYIDCASFTNETDCSSTAGCTSNFSDCSTFSGDQTACEATSGCSWSDPDCSGSYFTNCSGGSIYDGCSGSYDNYSCSGNYYTGNCSGVYGANCYGTPSCPGILTSGDCGSETGCTWSSVLNLTLPNSPPNGREYRIKNVATGGADCTILPYASYDIDGGSSLNLPAYKDSTMLVYFLLTGDCTIYSSNESTCGSTSGCSQNYSNCSWNGSSCDGGGSCSGYGDEASCNAATYFSSCSGTYTIAKRWHEMANR